MAKVSIIVPVYNVERYVRKCLTRLVEQTLKDIEIIIVDDGSTDNSAQIIKEFAKRDNRIKYYKKENGGLSDARNYGMKYATAPYIAFLDSDDYVDVTIYEKMYRKAKKDECDMVECNFYWIYPRHRHKNKKDIGKKYSNQSKMLEKARVVAWNKLYKREIIEKNKVQFPKGLIYEDIEFFYKLIPYIHTVSFVKEPLVYYVQRKKSIINKQTKKNSDIFKVFEHIVEYYQKNNFYHTYKEELEYSCARILLCSSFKRIAKIKDKELRKELLNETWIYLNTKFPQWKQNKILNINLNNKKRYMLSMNRFTYRVYAGIFKFI